MRYFDILASIRYKRRCEHAAAGGGLGLMGQRAAEQEYQQDVQQAEPETSARVTRLIVPIVPAWRQKTIRSANAEGR